jgi:hypothetical protein
MSNISSGTQGPQVMLDIWQQGLHREPGEQGWRPGGVFVRAPDVLVLTVHCKLINFAFQIFPLFIPEMSAGFRSYIVQVTPIYFAWIL